MTTSIAVSIDPVVGGERQAALVAQLVDDRPAPRAGRQEQHATSDPGELDAQLVLGHRGRPEPETKEARFESSQDACGTSISAPPYSAMFESSMNFTSPA
jgi:hypothetical protein